jgi:hypothetical protein
MEEDGHTTSGDWSAMTCRRNHFAQTVLDFSIFSLGKSVKNAVLRTVIKPMVKNL